MYRDADKPLALLGRKKANVSFRMGEFPSAPCFAGKKIDDSSRLDVVEIARVPEMFPSLFLGRAKDLSAPLYNLCVVDNQ